MFGRGSGHAADSGKAGPRREACSTQARQLIAKQACSVHSAGNLRGVGRYTPSFLQAESSRSFLVGSCIFTFTVSS